MAKYNVGIIGYGWAATAHIDAINACPDAEVVAIYSSRALDKDELKQRYGSDITPYRDVKKLIADENVNVVDICSYPYQHAKQAIAAAEAGKHLIVEKPLALSLKDVYAMQRASKKAGVGTCVCFEAWFSNQFQSTKAIIDKGLLGSIHYGEIDYYHGVGPWYGQYRWNVKKKAGGSSLLSAGCHAMDALRGCMEGEVVEVSSYATQSKHKYFKKYEYPTTTVTIMKFKDGRVGKTASVLDCLQPYYFHTHLVGSKGSLLDNKLHSEDLKSDKTEWSELSMKLVDSGDVADHPYQTQFEAFFDAMNKGKEMPHTSLDEAVLSHEIIFAADLSAAKGRPVKISEIRKTGK
jgi:UDP-N-acetyl-2-amino-2-deoxyglucuronate dehydrogenase